MNLLTLVNALLVLNIRVSIQKADALYKALGLDRMASDLEYYRGECQRLNDLNQTLTPHGVEWVAAGSIANGTRVFGTTTHDFLVEAALRSGSIIDNVANGNKIQAIKDLRTSTQCSLKEAKDAVEDRRVAQRASLPEWERDLLY